MAISTEITCSCCRLNNDFNRKRFVFSIIGHVGQRQGLKVVGVDPKYAIAGVSIDDTPALFKWDDDTNIVVEDHTGSVAIGTYVDVRPTDGTSR